ncbi:MAG: DUF2541 family protein [Cyclobacteriaceae bacterium]|nr:DUF2541 family protein [Cyclobacteriaceae bacterium]
MKTTKKVFVAILAFVAIAFFAVKAQSKLMANWTLLGSRVVDYTLDHDNITLQNKTEEFSAIKIKVKEGAVNVYKSTVYFTNGEKQDVELPKNLSESADGAEIDLKGDRQTIEKITFWYNTKIKSDQRSVIEVWGLQSVTQ